MSEHISSHFNQELEDVRTKVMYMGGLVEKQFNMLLNSLNSLDGSNLPNIIDDDGEINQLEIEIDDACQTIIARRQPAAGDLRFVLAVSRVTSDLERIGDELKKIALIMRNLIAHYEMNTQEIHDTYRLALMAQPMLHRALDAFARLDITALTDLQEADRLIDMDYRSQSRLLITYMMQKPNNIEMFVEMMMVNKSIERVGDHAKNIAEHVVYLVRGIDVRHSENKDN